ncbi:TPA: MFS transporter [Legionella pneumophila]
MSYLSFIQINKRFLGFGFLLTLFSSIGQTFFISLFNPYIQSDLLISNSEIGMIYSIATLCSAALMIRLGPMIDHSDLRRYTLLVSIGLCLACFTMAISFSVWTLFVCYVLLRLTGQGLLCHISTVSMARYFNSDRGKAISIASLGHPFGQIIFPILMALALTFLEWHGIWWLLTVGALIVILPVFLWLLHGHHERHELFLETSLEQPGDFKSGYVRFILYDWRFYAIAIGSLATGFINTGIFFQYHAIILNKNWSFELYSLSFIAYSGGNILGSLLIGVLIDRYKAINLLIFYLVPLCIGLVVLSEWNGSWVLFLFMLGAGISQGASSVLIAAVWSELYGGAYLGTVRSLVSVLQVIATGIAPVFFSKFNIHLLLFICMVFVCLSIALLGAVRLSFKLQKSEMAL